MTDYRNTGQLLDLEQAFLYQSDEIRGPMGGNTIAFASDGERDEFSKTKPGRSITWKELIAQ
jgi:nitrous oxide reductase accessory protein NosL